jgi:hypothetical protein
LCASQLNDQVAAAVGNDATSGWHHRRGVGLQDDRRAFNDLTDRQQSALVECGIHLFQAPAAPEKAAVGLDQRVAQIAAGGYLDSANRRRGRNTGLSDRSAFGNECGGVVMGSDAGWPTDR